MNLQSVIDKKKEAAEYMVSEITHICKGTSKNAIPAPRASSRHVSICRLDIFHDYLSFSRR